MQTHVLLNQQDKGLSIASDNRVFVGEGLFETLAVQAGLPCFAHLHWQRLKNSACALRIPFDVSFDNWRSYLLQQIQQDALFHGGIKVILSAGSAARGLAQQGQEAHMYLYTFTYTPCTEPVRLLSASWLRDEANPVYRHKSVNYLEEIMALRQADAKKDEDVLFFNRKHHATETTCANVFIVKDQQIVTPPIMDGVLPGITRSRIHALCQQQSIVCMEQSITKAMLMEADAVFVCNSLQGIRKVVKIDEHSFVSKHPLVEQLIHLLLSS